MTAMKKPAKKRKPVTIWCFAVETFDKRKLVVRGTAHDAKKAHAYLLQFLATYTLGPIVKFEVPW